MDKTKRENELVNEIMQIESNNKNLDTLRDLFSHAGWLLFSDTLRSRMKKNIDRIESFSLYDFDSKKEEIKLMLKENQDFTWILGLEKEAFEIKKRNQTVIERITSMLLKIRGK